MISLSFARCIAGTALVAFLLNPAIAPAATQPPGPQDFVGLTASGSYLAARHAGRERDAAGEAAGSVVAIDDGRFEMAVAKADRIISLAANHSESLRHRRSASHPPSTRTTEKA